MYDLTFYLSEMKGVLVVLAIYFDCKALTKKPFDMMEKEEVHTKKNGAENQNRQSKFNMNKKCTKANQILISYYQSQYSKSIMIFFSNKCTPRRKLKSRTE